MGARSVLFAVVEFVGLAVVFLSWLLVVGVLQP